MSRSLHTITITELCGQYRTFTYHAEDATRKLHVLSRAFLWRVGRYAICVDGVDVTEEWANPCSCRPVGYQMLATSADCPIHGTCIPASKPGHIGSAV